jgi:hypothetical protein
MPYAVLQSDLNPPSLAQLQRAFHYVPGLTPTDAHILGRDAFGILVKDLSEEQAGALKRAMQAEGIATEIVEQTLLPELPPRKLVHRVDCLPEHLLIYDPLGRAFPLDWRHVMFIAAGAVQLTEFVQRREERINDGHLSRYQSDEMEYDTVSRVEQRPNLIGEIIITDAVLRYSITASKFNFTYLGARNMENLGANFSLLMRDVIQFASNARLNRGAAALRDDATQILGYPSKNAFYEEIVWMLWQMKKTA